MAGLHPHGNPYLPNEVIAGWFGEEPENDHPIPLNDHHDEDLSDGANSEPEVENLPQAAPVPIPNPRSAFHGPTLSEWNVWRHGAKDKISPCHLMVTEAFMT